MLYYNILNQPSIKIVMWLIMLNKHAVQYSNTVKRSTFGR